MTREGLNKYLNHHPLTKVKQMKKKDKVVFIQRHRNREYPKQKNVDQDIAYNSSDFDFVDSEDSDNDRGEDVVTDHNTILSSSSSPESS